MATKRHLTPRQGGTRKINKLTRGGTSSENRYSLETILGLAIRIGGDYEVEGRINWMETYEPFRLLDRCGEKWKEYLSSTADGCVRLMISMLDDIPRIHIEPLSKDSRVEMPVDLIQIANYFCVICSKSFSSRRNLLRHRVMHSGSAIKGCSNCSLCGKVFTRKDNLDVHLNGKRCGTSRGSAPIPRRVVTVSELKKMAEKQLIALKEKMDDVLQREPGISIESAAKYLVGTNDNVTG